MPPVNPNWHAWTKLSIAAHIRAGIEDASFPEGLTYIIESLDEKDSSWDRATHRAEFTIRGPSTKGFSGNKRVRPEVSVLLSSFRTDNDIQHTFFSGHIASILDTCIIVRNISTAEPTGTFDVGELQPRTEDNEEAEVDGPLKPTQEDEQIHSIIRVRYEGSFSET